MDLEMWRQIPYLSWHVVLCQLTAFLSAMFALLCTRRLLVRLGFFRAESPSFSFGFNRAILGAQVAVLFLFLYALVLSFGAVVNPPAEKSLWTEYNCRVPVGSIALNVIFAAITVILALRIAHLAPKEDRREKEVRQGGIAFLLLLTAWVAITVCELFLVGGDYGRYKIMLQATCLLALAAFLFGTRRESPLTSRFALGLTLIFAMSMFTEVLAYSLAMRHALPQVQEHIEEICARVESQRGSTDRSACEIDTGLFLWGAELWCFWNGDSYELWMNDGAHGSFSYSAETKKWSAGFSTLWW